MRKLPYVPCLGVQPLLAALGAVRQGDHVGVFNDYRELGSMSMTSYAFWQE